MVMRASTLLNCSRRSTDGSEELEQRVQKALNLMRADFHELADDTNSM